MNIRSHIRLVAAPIYCRIAVPIIGLFYTGENLVIAAEEEATDPQPALGSGAASEIFNAGYAFEMLGALVLVFLCFFIVVLLVKRINSNQFGGKNHIQLMSSIGVGPREKVLLLQVGDTQLLLGSTPNNIRTLHTFSEPVVATEIENQMPSVFSSVLNTIGVKSSATSAASSVDKGSRL